VSLDPAWLGPNPPPEVAGDFAFLGMGGAGGGR
jgi:hypothetical protein